jgi:hypothetical protein
MGKSFTAKVMELKGDHGVPESAQYIIIFPGGSIEVSRTSNDEYWVHIEINTGEILPETVRASKKGQIIDSRLDYSNGIEEIPNLENLKHIAVRVSTKQS